MSTHPEGFENRLTLPMSASAERTYQALVRPDDLRAWFATDVDVEPRVGGRYAFHGRATLGTPDAAAATQTIHTLKPGQQLGFDWRLHDVPTRVTYTVKPGESEASCQLEVVHAVAGLLPYRRPAHVVDDLWRTHLGNLMAHLRGGDVVLPDFTATDPVVVTSIVIAAPPAQVWRALIEPTLMNQWLGGKAAVDLTAGDYSYGWSYSIDGRPVAGGPSRILDRVDGELLVTDWPDWRGDPDQPRTRVTWRLEALPPDGQRTRVTLTHDGFAHAVDRSDYQQGWGQFLSELHRVVEKLPAG